MSTLTKTGSKLQMAAEKSLNSRKSEWEEIADSGEENTSKNWNEYVRLNDRYSRARFLSTGGFRAVPSTLDVIERMQKAVGFHALTLGQTIAAQITTEDFE